MKKLVAIAIAFMFALCMPALAFAAPGDGTGGGNGGGGGNGSGGGNGGGSQAPLVVESTSIENGAELAAGDSITLVFSKNVCDAGVRDANMALVTVKDAQGVDAPVVVTLADDQVEPDKKNDMVIGFESPLAEGAYILTAQAGITSKSGDSLAEDYTLEFTVKSQEPAASASSAAASASASAASASASASGASAAAASADNTASQQSGPDFTIPIVIGVVAVVVIALAAAFFRKNK